MNAIVLVAAEKYDVQGLKLLAREKIERACYAKHRDSMALAKAAQTIYHQIKLPAVEMTRLKANLLWVWQDFDYRMDRLDSLRANDAQGQELREILRTNLDFLIDIQKAIFMDPESWRDVADMLSE